MSELTLDERLRLDALHAEAERRTTSRFSTFYPDGDGPLARTRYQKHLDFFAAGTTKERLFMAANRVGKSEAGSYELTCHLTGLYPHWWTGRRFDHPVECWAVGTNSQTTRDIVQAKLLGSVQAPGSGMIPAHLIEKTITARGLAGALEGAQVRHVSGGLSLVGLKTYEQGRQSFEGTAKHVIWCDEEPPQDCYTEMLYRTITTQGIIMVTFTPLQGMSEVVKGFLEPESTLSAKFKTFIQAGWRDVPHLDASEREALMATTPPYQIAARTEGEPSLGSGAIYPIAEREILVPTATIPETWARCYAMDVGWNRTAVVWAAKDPGSGQLILYDEHYRGQGEPASHAEAIKARGAWVRGVIDPASAGSNQVDGRALIDIYGRMGLRLEPAQNTVEAGLTQTWNLLVSGRLVVQEHLSNWRSEFRKYHRDEQGRIVKVADHLMDATRYLVMSGQNALRPPPRPSQATRGHAVGTTASTDWMGA
jgi:phage terminase large subunit-like protein